MRQDLVFAFRQMVRQPGLSLAAVLTLGLGLGASLAVFTLVNAVLLEPLPYPNSERVMAISRATEGSRGAGSHRDVDFLRETLRGCSPIAAMVNGPGLNVMLDGTTSYQQDRLVSHQYFDVIAAHPTWGRAFSAAEDAPQPPAVVILNERFVRQQRRDPAAVVGQSIELGGRPHTVIGVMGAQHTRPSDPDIYRPLGRDARGGGTNLEMLCRLQESATPATLNAELAALLEEGRRRRLFGERATFGYSAMSRHEFEFGTFRPQLNTLLVAVALVLVAAAANTTGLLLVRASGRRREIAVRTALGALPSRIARTLIVEGVLLATIAGVVGLLGAPLLVRGLLAVAPPFYGELAAFDINGAVLAAAVLLCAVVGLAVALPPLLEVLRVNLRDTLQEEGRSGTQGRRHVWMRQVVIGAETAVCAVLLVGALLLLRTFVNLMNVDTGVDSRGVVTARISIQGPKYNDPAQVVRFFEEGIARLEQSPAIASAAVGASLPAERALNLVAAFPDGGDANVPPIVNWRYVSPRYFPLLRMRSVAGRLFTEHDRPGAPLVAVVNETFARQVYGDIGKALGRHVSVVKAPPREIVGVVSDTSGWTLHEPARPMLFVPLAQVEPGALRTAHAFFPPRWIVRAARDSDSARRVLETVVRELDPSQPFIDIQTMDAMMNNSVSTQRFYLAVLSAFAIFAVLLAAVGIYATYSFAIASRATEIGVRLALGASPGNIVRGIVGRALLLGSVATGVGLATAAASARVLNSVLYNVSPSDPFSYGVVAVVLLATVAVATMIPAARAARIDPLVALRR
jgi:putative ABC transport system permease protein